MKLINIYKQLLKENYNIPTDTDYYFLDYVKSNNPKEYLKVKNIFLNKGIDAAKAYYKTINPKINYEKFNFIKTDIKLGDKILVKYKDKDEYNLINEEGELLFNDFFNFYYFNKLYNKLLVINKYDFFHYDITNYIKNNKNYFIGYNGKYTILNKKGNLLFKTWFNYIGNFNQFGLAKVALNKKWNLINPEGKLLSETWFNHIDGFNKFGLAKVELNKKWNYINQKGKLLSDIWFDYISNFNQDDLVIVELNNKWNYINREGELLFDNWFNYDYIYGFNVLGLAQVKLNKKWNLINKEGKLISDIWFNYIYGYDNNGLAQVELNKKWNLINKEGKLLVNNWYDKIRQFETKQFENNKYFLINKDKTYKVLIIKK